MALKKTVETNFGVPATYWKVCQTYIDWHDGYVHVELRGWPTEEARRSGKQAMMSKTYFYGRRPLHSTADKPFPLVAERNVVSDIYKELKKDPDWADAEDV